MVTDLMPASSPGRRSSTSALKPARSAQRRYMRMRFWAQSCDSVPPAPGWIERMAFFLSWGSDISWSIRASRVSLAGRSKMPPEVLELLLHVGEIALEVSEHVRPLADG